ncbi:hypothetical protein BGX34_002236 [Mortierella sp. NVP85]|nr:hypothetical protein BGX34_002236 [Mortierella sp. NVP85]
MTVNPRRLHTATWVDYPVNGIVVLGGEANVSGDTSDTAAISPVSILDVAVYDTAWSTVKITLSGVNDTALTLRGHSAVYDGNGNIYVFGGRDSNGIIRDELFKLDIRQPRSSWTLQFVSKAPEGRVHHTATLLPDGTILFMWGANRADMVQSTYMLYNVLSRAWTIGTALKFPPMGVIQVSNPQPGAEPPSLQKSNIKVPLIVGLSVTVLVFAITISIYRLRIRSSNNPDTNKEEEIEPPTPAFRDKVVSKDNVSGTQFSYGYERKLQDPLWISPGKSTDLRGPQYGAGASIFVYEEGPRAPQCPKGS